MNSGSSKTAMSSCSVVVDNDSWILPYAERIVARAQERGLSARLCRSYASIDPGNVAFFLGCIGIASSEALKRNRWNLVVHESDLPKGRGFSPLSWSILAGENVIPVCLIEAADEVDAGAILYKDRIVLEGHELIGEIRAALGEKTIELCERFLYEASPVTPVPQVGEPTYFKRRRPPDSRLDPNQSISDQFELLRIVDNRRYPAFFELRGHRYVLSIEKIIE